MLEDRLIYREVDVTLANFSVEYDGIPVVHPLQGTARAKINRLYGDFSHPQIVAELALGEVSVDMFDACLSSLIQLQDALATPEVAPGEAWTIQRPSARSWGGRPCASGGSRAVLPCGTSFPSTQASPRSA